MMNVTMKVSLRQDAGTLPPARCKSDWSGLREKYHEGNGRRGERWDRDGEEMRAITRAMTYSFRGAVRKEASVHAPKVGTQGFQQHITPLCCFDYN